MNVAIFSESLGCGGISSYCLELATGLRELPDLNVHLVAINDDRWRWLRDEADRRGLELYEIPVSGRFDWRAAAKVNRFLSEREIDLVHTQGYKLNLTTRIAKLLYRNRTVSVNTVHGVYSFKTSSWNSRIYYLADLASFALTDAIIAVSKSTAEQLAAWHVPGVDRTFVVPNGVRNPAPVDEKRIQDLRSRLGIRAPGETIGVVGRLAAEKGTEWLCAIIRSIIEARRQCKILIVGDGPLRFLIEDLQHEFPDNIVYVGAQHDVELYFKLMGVLVLPSRTEGMPMVILEAFSHSIPVVATRVGGVPEVVLEGTTGFLCEYGDTSRMVEAILALVESEVKRNEMAASAHNQYREKYNRTVMAERTFEVYQTVLAATKSPKHTIGQQ